MRTARTLITVAALTFALTGCAGTSGAAPRTSDVGAPATVSAPADPSPTPAASTPAPQTPTPAAATLKTGDVLPAPPDGLAPSQRAFPLTDGTFVIVDRYEPLPEPVQAAIQAAATAGTTGVAADYESVYRANQSVKSAIITATGKNVTVVYRARGGIGCNGTGADPWTFTGATAKMFDGCAGWAAQGEALAAAQQFVAARQDANTYVIVVGAG